MLFYQQKKRVEPLTRKTEITAGTGVGAVAGFLGGLLGVGGGNFILPVLNWIGLETKVAAATTSIVVVFSSFSGFLGTCITGENGSVISCRSFHCGGLRFSFGFMAYEKENIRETVEKNYRGIIVCNLLEDGV